MWLESKPATLGSPRQTLRVYKFVLTAQVGIVYSGHFIVPDLASCRKRRQLQSRNHRLCVQYEALLTWGPLQYKDRNTMHKNHKFDFIFSGITDSATSSVSKFSIVNSGARSSSFLTPSGNWPPDIPHCRKWGLGVHQVPHGG